MNHQMIIMQIAQIETLFINENIFIECFGLPKEKYALQLTKKIFINIGSRLYLFIIVNFFFKIM